MNLLQRFPTRAVQLPVTPVLCVKAPPILWLHWESLGTLQSSAGNCKSIEVKVELKHGGEPELVLLTTVLGVHVLEHQHEVGGEGERLSCLCQVWRGGGLVAADGDKGAAKW